MASIPSLVEVQKMLAQMEDKEEAFVGSRSWIGSVEVRCELGDPNEPKPQVPFRFLW